MSVKDARQSRSPSSFQTWCSPTGHELFTAWKYLSNTFLFSVSTFGSKLLLFLLTPFYTSVLTDSEYGVTDLIMQTGNVLIPIVSLGVTNAILRFGLEKGTDDRCVFTTGLAVIALGEVLLALFYPLLQSLGLMGDYALLLLLYVLMANLHSLFGSMAQALGKVRLYAVSGIVCTVLLVALNVLFLAVFRMGIAGYILSNVLADALAAAFLFFALRLWEYFSLPSIRREVVRNMLRYCLPLIPATVCSWIINISDRYFISYMLGSDVSGLYAVANKISTIMLILSNIFTSDWQLSAMEGRAKAERERFFSNVYSVYEALAMVGAAVLMAASRLIMRFLAAPDYFSAWHYAPVLTLGTALGCLGAFFATVYMVEKRSAATLTTTAAGAAVNLAGNALLIPVWGAMGAAIATLASYVVIFAARAIHSRTLLKVSFSVPRFLAAMAVLVFECFPVDGERTAESVLCCAAVALLYVRPLIKAARSGFREILPRRHR